MGDILIARTYYGYPDRFYVGDRIGISDNYTATCQKINKKGEAIFLFDQVFPKYVKHDEAITYANFYQQGLFNSSIRAAIVPFRNGDILRLPYAEEIFGDTDFVKPSGKKQWELMKTAKNRIAVNLVGESTWYWLANEHEYDPTSFAYATLGGHAYFNNPSTSYTVRPVFKLKIK